MHRIWPFGGAFFQFLRHKIHFLNRFSHQQDSSSTWGWGPVTLELSEAKSKNRANLYPFPFPLSIIFHLTPFPIFLLLWPCCDDRCAILVWALHLAQRLKLFSNRCPGLNGPRCIIKTLSSGNLHTGSVFATGKFLSPRNLTRAQERPAPWVPVDCGEGVPGCLILTM